MIQPPSLSGQGCCVPAWCCIALTALISSGCANIDLKGEEPEEVPPKAPHDLVDWTAKGKASFTYQDVSETARFYWVRSTPQIDAITLTGPFSMNRQTVERRDDQLLWRDGDEVRPLADLDPESPALTALTAVPPEALGRWLLGAQPGSADWEVDVTEWQATPPWQVPSRVTIRGSGMEIKVIVSKWEFSPTP